MTGETLRQTMSQITRFKSPFHEVYHITLLWLGIFGEAHLQQKMAQLAYVLAIVVFAADSFKVNDQVTLYAIALGIGVSQESLIAVLTMTVSLYISMHTLFVRTFLLVCCWYCMAKRNVVVRKLDALEALAA